jgi:hypothetical protein
MFNIYLQAFALCLAPITIAILINVLLGTEEGKEFAKIFLKNLEVLQKRNDTLK